MCNGRRRWWSPWAAASELGRFFGAETQRDSQTDGGRATYYSKLPRTNYQVHSHSTSHWSQRPCLGYVWEWFMDYTKELKANDNGCPCEPLDSACDLVTHVTRPLQSLRTAPHINCTTYKSTLFPLLPLNVDIKEPPPTRPPPLQPAMHSSQFQQG